MYDFDGLSVLVFLIIYIPIFFYLKKLKNKDKTFLILCTLFYIYIVIVIKYTLFPIMLRDTTHDYIVAYNLIPLLTLNEFEIKTSILNIIMFIPFGFLFYIISNFKFKKTLITAFLTSSFIELVQYSIALFFIPFRVLDINDVIFNSAGAFIGILIYLSFKYIVKLFIKKFNIKTNNFFDYIIGNNIEI